MTTKPKVVSAAKHFAKYGKKYVKGQSAKTFKNLTTKSSSSRTSSKVSAAAKKRTISSGAGSTNQASTKKTQNSPVSGAALSLLAATPFAGLAGFGTKITDKLKVPSLDLPKFPKLPEIPSFNVPGVSNSLGNIWGGITKPFTETAEKKNQFDGLIKLAGYLILAVVAILVVRKK